MKKNSKKALAAALICAVILSGAGCDRTKPSAEDGDASSKISREDGNLTDISADDIEKIQVLADAAICGEWEKGLSYNEKTDEVIWSGILYLMRDYASSTDNSDEAMVCIEKEKLTEYAASLFYGLEELPEEVPLSFMNQVNYSQSDGTYLISPSYKEENVTKLRDFAENGDGTYTAFADLYTADTDELLGTWEAVFVQNPLYSEDNDLSLKLALKELNLQEVFQTQDMLTKTATFLGLSDTHTVEVQYTNGEIAAFQFYEDAVAEKLSAFYEGESFTFVYSQNRETGESEIIEIY